MIEQNTKKESKEMETIIDITVAGRIDALNEGERHYKGYKRGNSWVYCHDAFVSHSGKTLSDSDFDYLALQLAFYLASWGMLRNSFLLELDYKIHTEPVKWMMEPKYRRLFTIGNPFANAETKEEYKDLMFGTDGIYKKLNDYYIAAHQSIAQQRQEINKKSANKESEGVKDDFNQESATLLTKILLGVYGCVPAYDRNFKKGISLFEKQQWSKENGEVLFHEKRGLGRLLEKGALTKALEEYHAENEEYTFMKVVDMYFFSLGAYFEEGYDKLSSDEKKAKAVAFKEKIEKEYRQ